MSLIKWTLALAGAALGVRHMSDRHRRRQADGRDGSDTQMADDTADLSDPSSLRPPRTDRDSPLAGGMAPTAGTGLGGGTAGSTTGVGSGSTAAGRTDDLLAPDSDVAPGSSSGRF